MIPAPLARLAYRVAYIALRVWSAVLRPHTRGVKLVLCSGDDVLLVRHSYGPATWDLPGGFTRRGESFEAAARRELSEELSAAGARPLADLGELRRRHLGRHETLHGFRLETASRTVLPRGVELSRVAWFPRSQLPAERAAIVDEMLALERRLPAAGAG